MTTFDCAYWPEAGETVRILSRTELWGRAVVEAFVPSQARVVRISAEELVAPSERNWSQSEVAFRAAAGRSLHLAARGQPVALATGHLEPLPHQLSAVSRALASDPVRLLLADEVGLGKTIEAGLIFSELKARGRAKRVLVVAPRGVLLQWVAEMSDRFGEEFALVGPEGVPVDVGIDPWRAFDRVVCSLDSIKPLRRRRGWTPEQLAEYNDRRFHAVVAAGWDLVIFDEAHHVAGGEQEVARHRLARELAETTHNVLLLSATPHSGKSEAFSRLLSLLDPRFSSGLAITHQNVAPILVRTEKRSAVNRDGSPLFQTRNTVIEAVSYGADRKVELALYDSVTEYVRRGYKQALRQKRPQIGFLVLLMQRLVSSSTAAILAALERRASALLSETQLPLFAESLEEWADLTGEEQVAVLDDTRGRGWAEEHVEVQELLRLARRAASAGPDAKATHLLTLLRRLQREEGDPSIKAVVFTEFVATQEMILDLLDRAGVRAIALNGPMGLEERRLALRDFRESARVLVSTDAGGEGINLQFAHLVVNYDLPWNPMRIEQRIGRVDRIGQRKPVRAFNMVMEHSIDARVIEILEAKLWTILRELGANKWNDVLETVSGTHGIEHLFAQAVVGPEALEEEAGRLANATQAEISQHSDLKALAVEEVVLPTPFSEEDAGHWARMAAEARGGVDGHRIDEAEITSRPLPEATYSETVPCVAGTISGLWSLWEVRPDGSAPLRDCFASFITDNGAIRPDVAERLWVDLAASRLPILTGAPLSEAKWEQLRRLGIDYGYRSCRDLQTDADWRAPWLVPILAVRVQQCDVG